MDYLSLKAAVSEAEKILSSSKITDAWQSGKNEVILLSKRQPGLLLSIDPVCPGVYMLGKDELSARVPSPFTDLLRARIKGTAIGSIRMPEPGERIVAITCAASWPAREGTPLELLLEVMGRRSNLMLLEKGRILQPLRAVSREKSPARPVLAGELYQPPPPQAGVPVEGATVDDLPELEAGEAAHTLRTSVRGLSPYSASQALAASLKGVLKDNTGGVPDKAAVVEAIRSMVQAASGETGYLHRSGGRVHLSPFKPVPLAASETVEEIAPFSAAAAAFRELHNSGAAEGVSEETTLKNLLVGYLERTSSALERLDAEEERCRAHDEPRIMAEALLIGAGQVKAGSASAVLPDPYDPGLTLTIPLDRAKSPQENANDLFGKARRLKRGLEETRSRRVDLLKEKEDTHRALEALTERGDREPARKLTGHRQPETRQQAKGKQYVYRGPGRRHIVDGFTILVGKSSTDNEKVTFKAAGPGDLWLHARDYPGSHVVIITQKRHVPDKVLYEAASLAAEGSGAKDDTAPEIMVAERKWVRKLKGGKPGQVTVEKFRTIKPRRNF